LAISLMVVTFSQACPHFSDSGAGPLVVQDHKLVRSLAADDSGLEPRRELV
jgi:hypothetical protein